MSVAAARGLSVFFCPFWTFCFTGTGRFARRGVFPDCRRNPLAARVLSGYSRNAGKRAVSSDFRVGYHIIRCMLICYARCFTHLIRVAAGEAHRPAGVLPNRYDSTEYKIIKACSFFFEKNLSRKAGIFALYSGVVGTCTRWLNGRGGTLVSALGLNKLTRQEDERT